jgi:ubiquinone/menaquinone biosynthesis C-methylase UbiE
MEREDLSTAAHEIDQLAIRNEKAAEYDSWYAIRGWWAAAEMREFLYRLAPKPDDVIADIGCGTGRQVTALAPKVKHVYAGDYSPGSIDVLNTKLAAEGQSTNVTTLVADMSQPLAIDDHVADKVISIQAFQHVPPAGRAVALQEFRRILKPGGRLFLQVYAYPSWVFEKSTPMEGLIEDAIYFRRWTKADLARDLTEAGYQVTGIYPMLCWPQLRRLGRLGEDLEFAAHKGQLPILHPAYWLAEATTTDDQA